MTQVEILPWSWHFIVFNFRKAKELINTIINRGGPPLPAVDTNHVPDGHNIVEMMIPGPKVGLVIGKGGETIRNLQVTTLLVLKNTISFF